MTAEKHFLNLYLFSLMWGLGRHGVQYFIKIGAHSNKQSRRNDGRIEREVQNLLIPLQYGRKANIISEFSTDYPQLWIQRDFLIEMKMFSQMSA